MEPITHVVLDVVEQFENLGTAEAVWNHFISFAKQFGFQFGALFDLPGPHERLEETMVCHSGPEGWGEHYFAQGYVSRDPLVLQSARSSDPYMRGELLTNPAYNSAQIRILHEAAEFGIKDGFVVPILSMQHGMTLVTVSGAQSKLSKRERAELQLAAICAHARIREVYPRKRRLPQLPQLSPRERECLAWSASGKSDWEIGEILSISERTAYAHIESVRRKYGVASRHQAIVLGLRSGAIYA